MKPTDTMDPYEHCIAAYAGHGRNALWEVVEAIRAGKDAARKTYDTGDDGAVAFDNASPYAPVSILVCPTAKPCLNFEHFALEAGADAIGRFMQAVSKVAREAVRDFDAAVAARPEAAAKRTFYEEAFAACEAAAEFDPETLTELTAAYIRDSKTHSFALRDRHTGHSGYRIAFNNGTGATGMSQPHMHAQIVAGRYLGGIAVPDPAALYPLAAFRKVAHSLIHRAVKGTN